MKLNRERRRRCPSLRVGLLFLLSSWVILVTGQNSGAPSSSNVGTAATTTDVNIAANDGTGTAVSPTKEKDACAGESWCSTLDENEILALEAIRCLHRQLDDDKDGNINLDESDEFLREELKYEKGYEKRQQVFHRNNDNQVSVRELWETWVNSEVHNWTMEQTMEWLNIFVGLPQYQAVFTENKINGTFLPRLAVNHQQFLSSTLGVKDVIHKQKVSLKAQDVVLFGSPKDYSNPLKDAVLTSLLVVAIGFCWLVYSRYKVSQRELIRMTEHMDLLASAEKELADLQKKMEKSEQESQSKVVEAVNHVKPRDDDSSPSEEIMHLRSEIEVLRGELQRAEIELQDKCWVPPSALQHWLQLTYELELKGYNRKKNSAERQLKLAKDACDKLKKKRSSLMGAFVSTHGRSIDDVDKAILEARTSLTEITLELQERMHRWKQIEMLVNSPIMNNPGLQYLENTLRGYGRGSTYGGTASVISNSQDDIDDDAASSIYCPSAVHKLVSTSSFLMFPGQQQPLPQFSTSGPNISSARLCSYQPMQCDMSSPQSVSSVPCFGINGNSNGSTRSNSSASHYFEQNQSSSPQTSPIIPYSNYPLASISEVASTTSSTDSDNSVSAPATTNSHLPIIRSKSMASMLSYRERAVRDLAIRDNRDAEDEIASEASEMVTAGRDRRVTFGIRTDHRDVKLNGENGKGGGEVPLATKENHKVEKRVEMKVILSPHPLISESSETLKELQELKDEDNSTRDPLVVNHTEEPDLIKIPLSLPSVKAETNGTATVVNSTASPIVVVQDGKDKESLNQDIKETGKENRGVWKSFSKFVNRGTAGIMAHQKHYRVRETPNGSTTTLVHTPSMNGNGCVSKPDDSESKSISSVTIREKKPLRLFSSFRRSHKAKPPV